MDNRVVVSIHQPNFMPWLGYFYKIWQSDIFIFLDDVQFIKTGSSYTNRVSVNISNNSRYLTIPIKRGSGVHNINETEFLNEKWKRKAIGTLQANYAKSPYFNQNKELIFELINFKANNLANYNINFIQLISKELNLDTKFIRSSSFNIKTKSTQRLVQLIKKVNGEIYISGEGGDNYQEHNMYKEENIEVVYNNMPNFEYNQPQVEKFISHLSVVDVIFNMGFENLKSRLFN
jgi:archaellin